MTPTNRSRGVCCALLLASAVACAPGARTPAVRPAPDAPAIIDRSPGARWIVRASHDARAHRLSVHAELVSRIDSTERVDTLQASLETRWTYSPAPSAASQVPVRIAGELREYRVAFGASALPETPPGLALPIHYAAEERARGEQPRLTVPRAEECTPAAASLAALRELWMTPPDTLTPGLTWTDSLEFATCRDSVPLTVRSTRTYEVLGAEQQRGEVVVRVERRSVTRMSGSGSQLGEPIEIVAEGEGTTRLLLSLAGGAILAGEGEAELRMTMTGRRREQHLVQRTRLLISLR